MLPLSLFSGLSVYRPTVIWSSHPSASALVAGLYARLRRVPWIVSYHADVSDTTLLRRLFTKIEPFLLRRADCVEVTSAKYLERLVGRGVPRARIMVVQPFTEAGRLGARRRSTYPNRMIAHGETNPLLFVGALDREHSYKHPELLIAAIGLLRASGKRAFAVFVGDGDRRRELERLASKTGADGLIRFAGRVSDESLATLYGTAWALVVPSSDESEGFGIVILEAISHGCPVLSSSSVPGIERFLNGRGGMTFRPGDVHDLAKKIERLICEPNLRRNLALQTSGVDVEAENERSIQVILGEAARLLRLRTSRV